jgi:hypothetical protein
MALQTSGQIKMSEMAAEFGDSTPYQMSEYYGGGDLVPAGANPGIATSGAINMNSFYGGVAATVLNITSNVNNYDIGAQAIAAGGDKSTPVILTINAGVTVGSTSSSTASMYTGTGWSSGTTINITNNGSIVGSTGTNTSGAGGSGGNGGRGFGFQSAYNGGSGASGSGSAESANNGGNAFEHSQTSDTNLSVIFDTAGTRTGGSAGTKTLYGGGGGGGGSAGCSCTGGESYVGGSGGGGGAGAPGGSGAPYNTFVACCAASGANGTAVSGGLGGVACNCSGGNGGNLGNGGGASSNPGGIGAYTSPGSGGSTGYASGSSGSALSGNTSQIS